MLKDKLQRVKLADLNPAKYNPNEMDVTERRLLKQSLKHYGYIENIVVNKDLTIIDGHHRVEELLDSGVEEEDVVILDLSKDEEKALNLALRRIKGKADPVLELKIIEDLSLKGFDVELAGFDDVKLQELSTEIKPEKKEVKEDDFDPESVSESTCKKGDLWQLGRHRLLCGDATTKEDLKKLVANDKIDMVFTDPPYDFKDVNWLQPLFKDDIEIFVMNSDKRLVDYASIYGEYFRYFFTVELSPAILVNNKMAMTGHDLIGYFRKGKTRLQNLHDAFSTHIKLNKRKDGEHRHEKKIELPSNFIQHYSFKNENILDLFGGSGSTLIACEQLERNCYMMELEPSNCDIIIKRFEDFTGEKANKIS